MQDVNVFWFRRDLRLEDQAGLYYALKSKFPVLPIFIFDKNILERLDRTDSRIHFIHDALSKMNQKLNRQSTSILTFFDEPLSAIQQLSRSFNIHEVFANHDYEPYAIERDNQISSYLTARNIKFSTFKDQVIFEKLEICKKDGSPYNVFTPYSNEWKRQFRDKVLSFYPSEKLFSGFIKLGVKSIHSLEEIGFSHSKSQSVAIDLDEHTIKDYEINRNIPARDSTSKIGVHLRFGTVSIRKMVALASNLSEVWLNELIWREFFMMIIYNYPFVVNSAFKSQYNNIPWRNDESEFEAWTKGKTGYPLVDAGMRQLNETGWMHNRVRMVVAGFLCKHLLVDWRWGEAWFAAKLLDYELSSNNGNWQWAAGTGCDAAPYFRIFNPLTQASKFDPQEAYVNRWIPELKSSYTKPIVDHTLARNRAITVYKNALER